MRPINVEILMGHSTGISDSYYKPKETELLSDYQNAVELLTISQDESSISRKIKDLEQKNANNEYIIKGKIQEKDEEIKFLNENYQNEIKSLREDMENKFQQLLTKIDTNKI